ncbi:DUF1553 domain-containing protein [Planctomicrobium sp. SH664]|uniref:DUF1553 domain-containing protein n=1 Tax=Planctomicrobium sp. SH664 TaxID=3448125 RepID=UPI003F5C89C0
MPRAFVLLLIVLGTIAPSERAFGIDYERDVRALLKVRCWACHGALKQESGLRLDTALLMRQGGESGPAVVSGKPEESLLLQRISDPDPASRMPPEGAMLTPEQIAAISTWIESGALATGDEVPETDPAEHWSFQRPIRPTPSALKETGRATNPVDQFLLAVMEQRGLTPRPSANRSTLLRRLFLDLVGVPPTVEELRDFLNDESPEAYEAVVDRLLEDPRYGQRWARHWLDVWRYSDWYGRREVSDVRNSAPQIWRWRDWVVSSLNADVGYDEMIRLMLAADEIGPEDDDAVVATGYLIRNWYAINPNDWMRSNVEHVGKAFLGLTFNCAHCHDHKYDPIRHDEYFKMRAWFEPINVRQDRIPGEADPGPFEEYVYSQSRKVQRSGLVRIYDRHPDAATWFYTGGDERNRRTDRGTIPPGLPAFLKGEEVRIEPVALPPPVYYPGLRPDIQETMRRDLTTRLAKADEEAATARKSIDEMTPGLREQLAAAERALKAAVITANERELSGALEGQLSLLLDAAGGRRTLLNGVQELHVMQDGLTIAFRCRIVRDAHCNFQLVRDSVEGRSATVVVFDHGRIWSYRPRTTSEFEVGRYDWRGGQTQFHVALQVDQSTDVCRLTVRSELDGAVLVDGVPVALNGWNPIGNPRQGIAFDARGGSRVLVDSLRFYPPAQIAIASGESPAPLLAFEFEEPAYQNTRDVVGFEGWSDSRFSVGPAISEVTGTLANDQCDVRIARAQLQAARHAEEGPRKRLAAAEAKIEATRLQLLLLEAKIAADRARYGNASDQDAFALARAASQLEREAAVKTAMADLLQHESALLAAQARSEDDKDRQKELDAATKGIASAKSALDASQQALQEDAPSEHYTPLTPVYPAMSTGRRRALAEWITRPANPLTARVAVNHIWMRHFRVPLVTTVYDFGRNGAAPTHPELLDWLAVEFMESGWSMKHLHRLLVTSEAYRRTSSVGDDEASNLERDPDNRFLWRMNSSRMEAEVVRDSLLACGGKLDLKMGGQELENSESLTTYRRSLYYSSHPEGNNGMSPLGALFDAPNAIDCYRRTETVVPQQALALTNSQLVHAMSAEIIRRWPPTRDDAGKLQREAFVDVSFERILSRLPTEAERRLCLEGMQLLQEQMTTEGIPDPEVRACEALIRSLFNHNDFVTIR